MESYEASSWPTDLRLMLLGVQLTVLGIGIRLIVGPGLLGVFVGESLVPIGTLVFVAGWIGERGES